MITLTKTEDKNLNALSAFLKGYKLDSSLFMDRLDQTILILDGSNVLGFGAFILKDGTGLIDVAIIKEEILWGSLGDGLIKAMLNTLDLRGAVKAYMLTDSDHSKAVTKIGLKSSAEDIQGLLQSMDAPYIMKSQNVLFETKLPDFFDHACHSKK